MTTPQKLAPIHSAVAACVHSAVAAWRTRPESFDNMHLHQAADAFYRGHYRIISTGSVPYLIRFWLSVPLLSSENGETVWESGDSHLLHWILKPDPDRHLHDHPWTFTTRIIRNGYVEETPSGMVHRWPGTYSSKKLGTPHRIAALLGDFRVNLDTGKGGTWTDVTTGPRVATWGFHTPGGWIDHRQYFEYGQEVIPFGEPIHEK